MAELSKKSNCFWLKNVRKGRIKGRQYNLPAIISRVVNAIPQDGTLHTFKEVMENIGKDYSYPLVRSCLLALKVLEDKLIKVDKTKYGLIVSITPLTQRFTPLDAIKELEEVK